MRRELEGISRTGSDYLHLASRGKRLGGVLLDVVITGVVAIPLLMTIDFSGLIEFSTSPTLAQTIASSFIGFAVFLALHGYLLHKRGQTIGKYLVGTRIVLLTGETPSLARTVLLRYVVPSIIDMVPYVGFLFAMANPLFIFGEERRCLHDYIAGTRVIDSEADLFDR